MPGLHIGLGQVVGLANGHIPVRGKLQLNPFCYTNFLKTFENFSTVVMHHLKYSSHRFLSFGFPLNVNRILDAVASGNSIHSNCSPISFSMVS
jgi:hypothetical protein